jgi:hypothetical protein
VGAAITKARSKAARTTRDKVEVNMYMLADVSETQEETVVPVAAQPQEGLVGVLEYEKICEHLCSLYISQDWY